MFLRIALSGLLEVLAKVQIPWQAWHFVTCDKKWQKFSHETSILKFKVLRFEEKIVGKVRF